MNKNISFKLWLTVLCKGICQFFQRVAKLFGYKEGTVFGKVVWRICACCITLLLSIFTIVVVYTFVYEVVYCDWIRPHTSEVVYDERYLSNHIVYQNLYYQNEGRIYDDVQKKVVVDKVDWVVTSDEPDSLAIFSKGGKRGYLNRFTGEIEIPAIYTRAWGFSEGLAAVEKDGELLFIDHSGHVVIDKDFEVYSDDPEYAFHDGYCVMQSAVDGKLGLIDREGNWALQPEYDGITHEYSFWKVEKDELYGLYSDKMELMFDVVNPQIEIDGNAEVIEVRFPDHTAKRFDFEGNVLVDFVIDHVTNMHYSTTELNNQAEEAEEDDSYSNNSFVIYAVAQCQKYLVSCGYYDYYGLIDRNGRIITQPEYSSIDAIAEDLYLCQPHGIIINGKGERVK